MHNNYTDNKNSTKNKVQMWTIEHENNGNTSYN